MYSSIYFNKKYCVHVMYALFQKNECAKATSMALDHANRQDTLFFNRIDAMPTYMRCFKNSDLEHKMRTDSFKTRTYGPWDCQPRKCDETNMEHVNSDIAPIESIRPIQTRRC